MTNITAGVWAASLTPLNQDLSIDLGAYAAHWRALLDQGCAGLVALGTTGEANSFSLSERLELIASLGEVGFRSERTMIGTGCCAEADTIALTRAALDAGFANVLMLPPFYYKNVSDEGLFRAYVRVIEAVNDPRLNVIIYDIPPMVGFRISLDLLRRLREAFPETVLGVKNSSGDWSAMEAALSALPGFRVFVGSEQFLLPTLRAGGPGCISAIANVTAASLAELNSGWRSENADALQERAISIRQALQPYATVPALKEIMAHASGRAAWRCVRPPLVNLSGAKAAALFGVAREFGLL